MCLVIKKCNAITYYHECITLEETKNNLSARNIHLCNSVIVFSKSKHILSLLHIFMHNALKSTNYLCYRITIKMLLCICKQTVTQIIMNVIRVPQVVQGFSLEILSAEDFSLQPALTRIFFAEPQAAKGFLLVPPSAKVPLS